MLARLNHDVTRSAQSRPNLSLDIRCVSISFYKYQQFVFDKARRHHPEKLLAAKKEFQYLVSFGIVGLPGSPWATLLHIIVKQDGDWRLCEDYRALNQITISDRYRTPHIHDFSLQLNDKALSSKMDPVRAYHQIPMNQKNIATTAVIIPFDPLVYPHMSFGLRKAAQFFQRFTGLTEIDFLGHHIDTRGIAPLPGQTRSVTDYLIFQLLKGFRRFLAVVNYYGRFIPNCVRILKLLTDLPIGNPRHFTMTPEAGSAFDTVKKQLPKATTLNHLNTPRAVLIILRTDASQVSVGAVLYKIVNSEFQPLSYSKSPRLPKQCRALLAIYPIVKHFRYILDGRQFTIYTDQKLLIYSIRALAEKFVILTSSYNSPMISNLSTSNPELTEITSNPSLPLGSSPLHTTGTRIHCDVSIGKPSISMDCRSQAFVQQPS
nr:gag pol polyprotein [Hymenolepis microstoma]